MHENVFVQFFNHRIVDKHYETVCLSNGLSTALDYCKENGDLVWVQTKTYLEGSTEKNIELVKPPIKKGNLFVSCFYISQAFQAYVWAKEYSDLNVICGGPSIGNFKYKSSDIPINLHFETRSIEEYFGYKPFSKQWKLQLPDNELIKKTKSVFFSYEIEEHCYHGKCIFCNLHHLNEDKCRIKKDLTFNDLKNSELSNNYEKRIWLHTPSAKPNFLKNYIKNLPTNNFQYYLFLRADKIINKCLLEILKEDSNYFSNITFSIGIDFLGNRLLDFMQKKNTCDDIIETLRILNDYNIKSTISVITRWPNIIEEDYNEVKKYIQNHIVKQSKAPWVLNDLISKPNTPLLDFDGEEIYIGPFLVGKYPNLTKKSEEINKKIEILIKDNIQFVYERTEKNHRPFLF